MHKYVCTSLTLCLYLYVEEIIEKLKYPDDDPLLRPDTSLLKCQEFIIRCMQECWQEEPESRPDFKNIRILLKHMQRGM